jgi:hypothetical protein
MPIKDQRPPTFRELAVACVSALGEVVQAHISPGGSADDHCWISQGTFIALNAANWIVDGRAGGLLLGRSHAEGHIFMLRGPYDGRFEIFATMQGGEYVLNHAAYTNEKSRVEEINAFKDEHAVLREVSLSPSCRILNTHATPHDKLLWIGDKGVFIVNARATAKHIREIEAINQKWNPFFKVDLMVLKPK